MTVCIDIGGGTTRVGVSKDNTSFRSIERFATRENFNDEMVGIIQVIKKHASTADKIVIASAGLLDRKKGVVVKWGQKHLWWGKSLFAPLADAFPKASLYLENDANIAALGEAVFGAGKRYSLVGYLTLSSGVGGCLIHNKSILPHAFGIEPGHQIINFRETKVWSCGQRGCFEAYVSGTAFKKIFGIAAEECIDPAIWERYAKLVAVGVANLIALWSPEIMIIGGGVAKRFNMFITPLQSELKLLLPLYHLPTIAHAELSEAGLYGGLVFSG